MKHIYWIQLTFLISALVFGNFQPALAYTEPTIEEISSRYEALTFKDVNGNVLPYRFFKPANYNPNVSYPLVLFLHGSGERGTDNLAQLKNTFAGAFSDSTLVQKDHPCFLIVPQSPSGWGIDSWPTIASLELVKQVQSEFNIDLDRTYITGLSMGAIGIWPILIKDYSMFAAAVPVSGGPRSSTEGAENLIDFPIWAFHGTGDTVVEFSTSYNMISAINNAGGNAMLTPLKTAHDAWIYAYVDPYLIDWLFSQKRNKPFIPDTQVISSQHVLNLEVNETASISFNTLPDDAANKYYLSWTSSNPGVASVSYTGLVKGLSDGSTTIILTTQKGNTDSCLVNVKFIETESVSLNTETATLSIDSTLQIVASVLPLNASNPTIFWESSDKAIATVNSSKGLVKGIATGIVTIKATTKNSNKTAECKLTVIGPVHVPESLLDNKSSFNINPNPSSEILTISNISSNSTLSVFSLDGRLKYKTEFFNRGKFVMPVGDWEKGLYLFYFKNEGGTTLRKAVIN